MSPPILHRFAHALAALWCVALLVSCGGAGELGSGGTGSGAAVGTVTGFGSIFVDGARFDDSNAVVQTDNLQGGQDAAEAKLGQRVEIDFAVDGVAQTVNIEPELVGVVSAPSSGGFTVLGQGVEINLDAAAGPVTQFDGGYAALADVKAGDYVEVHGVARSATAGTALQATRVEKLLKLPYLRVAGTVGGLTAAGPSQQFNLGALVVDVSRAVLVPAARTLANGQSIVVLAKTDDLDVAANPPRLTAKRVRIREHSSAPVQAYVGGVISNLGASSFSVGDIVVHYSGATAVSGGNSQLANGKYVQVRGDFAADGSLPATGIKIRDGALDGELRGTVAGYDATAHTFSVRDVRVDASLATVDESCVGGVADGLFVEVQGRLGLQGVVAQTIRCSDAPSGAIIEKRGVASGVDAVAKTFTLTLEDNSTLTVRWTLLTFFRDVQRPPLGSLDAQALRVEGVLGAGNVLVATKIRLDH